MVETKTTIKENDTMKMPTMNFDFGPFTEPGVVTLSPYAGFAVGDVTALACYKYVYNESKAYLKERLKYEV